MTQRTGLPSIKELCEELCKFLAVYIPVIKKLFPDETEIHTALEALQVLACAMVADIDAILPEGD